ncbi:MAG: glycoside hydrolase family protein [Ramlibacter sp.]|nr:glycoside hydrolase family protein [Ramlibacter sp.]
METLKLGSRGGAVAQLQQVLGIAPDGIYGPATREAVHAWQQRNGLVADGIAGLRTLTALHGPTRVSERGNRGAFLDMLAWSEIGDRMLADSNNGYDIIVGSKPGAMIRMASYADHPRRLIRIKAGLASTAAGRYQLLSRYYDAYTRMLGLRDFSPRSQDRIAIQQIRERRALPDIDAGRFDLAVSKCRNIWASLPGAGYGQHENSLNACRAAYVRAGGKLA